jgi:hypothetical protein
VKTKMRQLGWLLIGFVSGVVLTVTLTPTRPQPLTAPATPVAVTGPVVIAWSFQYHPLAVTNVHWRASSNCLASPPRVIESFDPKNGGDPTVGYPTTQRRLDLIDFGYQPNIKLDDLK